MNRGFIERTSRRIPLAMALACVLAVAFALFAQYVWDMRPCPWCVLQRLIFLVIAVLSLICALVPWRRLRLTFSVAILMFASTGILAAVYQHEVASKQFSCNLTFADTLVSALRLEALWPAMFKVTATCAEASVSMLGVPFEYWSLGLFALLAIGAATLALRSVRVRID
jgi:disulfide bond formation protein DsbB